MIKIYYRYSQLDKQHFYSVVCERGDQHYSDYWIYWLWYHMGEMFTKKEKKQFRLSAYNCSWDENEKLIKEYKSINSGGVERIVAAIRNHFKKLKQ